MDPSEDLPEEVLLASDLLEQQIENFYDTTRINRIDFEGIFHS